MRPRISHSTAGPCNSANSDRHAAQRQPHHPANAGGGTLNTQGNVVDYLGQIAGNGGLTVNSSTGGYLDYNNNFAGNTYSGGTVVGSGAEIRMNNYTDTVVSGGSIQTDLFGSGPVTFNNNSTYAMDIWNNGTYPNAFSFNGTFNLIRSWGNGDGGHGMWISNTDATGNANSVSNSTTIAPGGAYLQHRLQWRRQPDHAAQPVVGGPITVDGKGGTGNLFLSSPATTFPR